MKLLQGRKNDPVAMKFCKEHSDKFDKIYEIGLGEDEKILQTYDCLENGLVKGVMYVCKEHVVFTSKFTRHVTLRLRMLSNIHLVRFSQSPKLIFTASKNLGS